MSVQVLFFIMIQFLQPTGKEQTYIAEKFQISPSSQTLLARDSNELINFDSGIRCVLHDSKGNYWFGSHTEGLCLFDGKEYTYFNKKDGLSGNQIRSIQEDVNGIIWFGTDEGVSSYVFGKIKNYMNSYPLSVSHSSKTSDWSLSEDLLWFNAGNRVGVYRTDGQKVSYLPFPIDEKEDQTNFSSHANTGFSKGNNGKVWFATYSALLGYDGTSFEIVDERYFHFTDKYQNLHIRAVLEDSKGNVWIGNNGIGVLLKKGNTLLNFSQQHGLIHQKSLGGGATSPAGTLEHVFTITEDQHGNIWFGDRDTGAWKYDGTSLTNYIVNPDVLSPMIYQICQDPNGDLLFAMASGGVYVFRDETFYRLF